MKTRAYILNVPPHKTEVLEMLEWEGHLTSKRFKRIIDELFFWAANSIIYRDLKAVIKKDGKEIMTINCKTISDGSAISAHLTKNGRAIRTMTIAA